MLRLYLTSSSQIFSGSCIVTVERKIGLQGARDCCVTILGDVVSYRSLQGIPPVCSTFLQSSCFYLVRATNQRCILKPPPLSYLDGSCPWKMYCTLTQILTRHIGWSPKSMGWLFHHVFFKISSFDSSRCDLTIELVGCVFRSALPTNDVKASTSLRVH